jgi:hypothetical protein
MRGDLVVSIKKMVGKGVVFLPPHGKEPYGHIALLLTKPPTSLPQFSSIFDKFRASLNDVEEDVGIEKEVHGSS